MEGEVNQEASRVIMSPAVVQSRLNIMKLISGFLREFILRWFGHSTSEKCSLADLREQLEGLTLEGLDAIDQSAIGIEGCQKAIAYYDSRKDNLITSLDTFQSVQESIGQLDEVRDLFGSAEAKRITIQFVFNSCAEVANGSSPESAFEQVWTNLNHELAIPTWTYFGVANMQNITCSEQVVELEDGVSIRQRSFEELSILLDWGSFELDHLTEDWKEGVASSLVILVEKMVPKKPENFLFQNDGSTYLHVSQSLLAMRLVAPGDVRIGKLFFANPATFNVGKGGFQSSGYSAWYPGSSYELTQDRVTKIRELYKDLNELENRGKKTEKNLLLALRSFSSIYDRRFHEAEDRVVDAITALEALWRIDIELSFKLAFRTASLLARSDDERISIYEMLTTYYRIRNKVVHGGILKESQEKLMRSDEPLRTILRRTLRAFLHLATNPTEDWTLDRLYDEADSILMHTSHRTELQLAMGIEDERQ